VREEGRSTADPKALDADVILAAQFHALSAPNSIIATTNVAHLGLAIAAQWQSI
jgi:hypothetical protein